MHRRVKPWKFADSGAFYVLFSGLLASIFLPLTAISAQPERTVSSVRFSSAAPSLFDRAHDSGDVASTNFTLRELGIPVPPGDFTKLSPSNSSTGIPVAFTMDWGTSSGASTYEYCIDLTDNNACDGDLWMSAGIASWADITGLASNTQYYWQARAINGDGTTEADGGNWWTFRTGVLAGAFNKHNPANNSSNLPFEVSLIWDASSGATGYEYCLDLTNNDSCDEDNWLATSDTSVSTGVLSQTTSFHWQVRAINSAGSLEADSGVWWKFTTGLLPGVFSKQGPANNSSGLSLDLDLSWGSSSGATGYEYCFDLTNNDSCDGDTWNATANTNVSIGELSSGTSYYWQIRAVNGIGDVEADNRTWWSFTAGTPPAAFGKQSPSDNSTGQPIDISLTWDSSSGTAGYEVCIDQTDNDACEADNWIATTNTSFSPITLSFGTSYYWQVRANSNVATVEADGGVWWKFTTLYEPASAAFSGSPTIGIAPILVDFINESTGSFDLCEWDFGDGASSTNCGNQSHVFESPGVYTVSLTISGLGGTDIATTPNYIEAKCGVFLPMIVGDNDH